MKSGEAGEGSTTDHCTPASKCPRLNSGFLLNMNREAAAAGNTDSAFCKNKPNEKLACQGSHSAPREHTSRVNTGLSVLNTQSETEEGPTVSVQVFKEGDKFWGLLSLKRTRQGYRRGSVCAGLIPAGRPGGPGRAPPATAHAPAHNAITPVLSTRPSSLPWIDKQNRRHIPAPSFPTFLN